MATKRSEQAQQLQRARLAAAAYSIVFVAVIFFGYFLLAGSNAFLGVLIGAVMAGLAWLLARLIGMDDGGVRGNIPAFVALLVISAVGVMNAAFLNLEGRQVFTETIAQSQDDFTLLGTRATEALAKNGVVDRRNRVEVLADALEKEIANPLNCGQGPAARAILAELANLLPGFRPLTGAVNCSRNAAVNAAYKDKIAVGLQRAPWNRPALAGVAESAVTNRARLQTLQAQAAGAGAVALIREVKPPLNDVDLAYRSAFGTLQAEGGRTEGLPNGLPLAPVESLGEWSQLLGLVIARLDRPSTYVYIAGAVAFDWFMVWLFARVRLAGRGLRGAQARPARTESAW